MAPQVGSRTDPIALKFTDVRTPIRGLPRGSSGGLDGKQQLTHGRAEGRRAMNPQRLPRTSW